MITSLALITYPVHADDTYRICGRGMAGYMRAGGETICIKKESGGSQMVKTKEEGTGREASAECGANGWCRVATAKDGSATMQVKMFNSIGGFRSAFINGETRPTGFDCQEQNGKRYKGPGDTELQPVFPGTLMEAAFDYVCGR